MKNIFKYLAVLIFLIAATSNGLYAKKTEIRLILKKGQQFEYLVSATQLAENRAGDNPIEIEQKMELTIHQIVLDKLRNGNYLLQADYKKFTMEVNSQGQNQKYDSNASDNPQFLNDLLKGLTKIQVKFEVSPLGVVSNLTGFEEYTKDIALNARLFSMIKDFGTDKIISQMFNYIPKTKVEQGDKWITSGILPDLNNLKYDINFTMAEVSPENVKLDLQAKFKYVSDKPMVQNYREIKVEETGVQKGNVVIDSKNCMPLSKVLNQKIDMVITATDTKTKAKNVSQMKLTYKTMMKLVK
ncbi:MAG TPA: DUF6263 family protein [Prolixibacteraceae bacterium]